MNSHSNISRRDSGSIFSPVASSWYQLAACCTFFTAGPSRTTSLASIMNALLCKIAARCCIFMEVAIVMKPSEFRSCRADSLSINAIVGGWPPEFSVASEMNRVVWDYLCAKCWRPPENVLPSEKEQQSRQSGQECCLFCSEQFTDRTQKIFGSDKKIQ